MTAVAALGPALLPVLGGVTVAAGALGVSLASSGAALGVFGAVGKAAYADVGQAATKLTAAHTALAAADTKVTAAQYALSVAHTKTGLASAHHRLALAMAEQSKAAGQLAAAQRTLTGPLGEAAAAQNRTTAAWEHFVKANSPAVYAAISKGFGIITTAIPKLEPLFTVAAHAVGVLEAQLSHFVTGGGLDRLVKFMAAQAGPALAGFTTILGNLARGFGALGADFGSVSGGVIGWLVRMSAAFADWAKHLGPSGGFAKLVGYVKANAPALGASLAAIALAMGHITAAVAPLAPVSLAIAKALSGMLAALPIPVVTGLAAGFIGLNVALKATAAAAVVAAAAEKANAIATGLNTSLVGTFIGVKYLEAAAWFRATIAARVYTISAAIAEATSLPLIGVFGAVAVAAAALGVGVYFLAKNWTKVWGVLVRFVMHDVVAPILVGIKTMGDGFLAMLGAMLGAASHLPFVGSKFKGLQDVVNTFAAHFDASMGGAIASARRAGDGIGHGVAKAGPPILNVTAAANGLTRALNGIPPNTVVRITTQYATLGDPTALTRAGHGVGYSRGGPVLGGVPGRDSVPALLMPGEEVLTVGQAKAYRAGNRGGGSGGDQMLQPLTITMDGQAVWQGLLRVKRRQAGGSLGL